MYLIPFHDSCVNLFISIYLYIYQQCYSSEDPVYRDADDDAEDEEEEEELTDSPNYNYHLFQKAVNQSMSIWRTHNGPSTREVYHNRRHRARQPMYFSEEEEEDDYADSDENWPGR